MNYPQNIWDTELDYLLVGSPLNYTKRIRIKQKYLASAIKYYKELVNNTRYTKGTRETIFLPTLRKYLRVQKTYEKQASLLAA